MKNSVNETPVTDFTVSREKMPLVAPPSTQTHTQKERLSHFRKIISF